MADLFFFKQKAGNEVRGRLGGSEMFNRDRVRHDADALEHWHVDVEHDRVRPVLGGAGPLYTSDAADEGLAEHLCARGPTSNKRVTLTTETSTRRFPV